MAGKQEEEDSNEFSASNISKFRSKELKKVSTVSELLAFSIVESSGAWFEAVSQGNVELVQDLIKSKAQLDFTDYDKRTALHIAASEGNFDMVQLLCETGADVNVVDKWQKTPLQDALTFKHTKVAEYLSLKGGKIKASKHLVAAMLCIAAAENDLQEIRGLVLAGVNVNSTDYDNRTALHVASVEGFHECAKLLLYLGASPTHKDRWNHTPLSEAKDKKMLHILKTVTRFSALEDADADESTTEVEEMMLNFELKDAEAEIEKYEPELVHPKPKFQKINYDDIELNSEVGAGAFGAVFVGKYNGENVAVKRVKLPQEAKSRKKILKLFYRETKILQQIDISNYNVVTIIGACFDPEKLCIVEEYVEGTSLYTRLHSSSRKSNEDLLEDLQDFGMQIAKGMAHLHKNKIIHRDLKSQNIVIENTTKRAVIVDFGASRIIPAKKCEMTTETGTYRWMAPELIKHKRNYDEKVDVYSFGIILWEMLTRSVPFPHYSPLQAAMAVSTKGIRPSIPAFCPAPLASLIRSCWSDRPKLRPSFSYIADALGEIPTTPAKRSALQTIVDSLRST